MSGKQERLFEVAEGQQGFFTAGQAVACGYPTSSHVYHLKAGTWQREHRGIYRLTRFPAAEHGQYVLWSLWSRNRKGVPQGVYSHQTALSLFDLSDLMPTRLHMTVPPGFRRNAPIPAVLILHREKIEPDEIEEMQGFRVARPIRAVADLLAESAVSPDHLLQALREGLKRGLITRAEIDRHAQRQALKQLLRGGHA
jgi:predicted transcriptional regulator of viral defense system